MVDYYYNNYNNYYYYYNNNNNYNYNYNYNNNYYTKNNYKNPKKPVLFRGQHCLLRPHC